jgi:hypothetical protein
MPLIASDCLSDGAAPPWTLEQGAREPLTLVLLPDDDEVEDKDESEVGGRDDVDASRTTTTDD